MARSPIVEQILLCKRLFSIGEQYAERPDPVSAGLAISLFQDAVELFLWSLVKHFGGDIKKKADFPTLLEEVRQASGAIEGLDLKAQMLELNSARVNFKHYGNLPAPSEASKFLLYTRDFLNSNARKYLDLDYSTISTTALVENLEIRGFLEAAEYCLQKDDYGGGLGEIAKGHAVLLGTLNRYLPQLDFEFAEADGLINAVLGGADRRFGSRSRNFGGFKKLRAYLLANARANTATLLGVSIHRYDEFTRSLPFVMRFAAGNFRVREWGSVPPTLDVLKKAIDFLTEVTLRVERFI